MNGSAVNHPSHFTVGLTGGIGSGKSRVADAFAERGAHIVDTDVISRQLTAPGGLALPAIVKAFGPDALAPDGAMDRRKMRELIFANPAQKTLLESILHPMIRSETQTQVLASQGDYTLVVVPLLAESGHWKFPRTLVVDCDEQIQIQRVMQRDGLREELVRSIIAQQASRQQRLSIATDVIQNHRSFTALLPEIDRLHRIYCELAGTY